MKLEPDFQESSQDFIELPVHFQLGGDLTGLLKVAVKMAQSGKKLEAKRIFMYIANSEPNNEAAWLWLASLSEYPEELLCFLKNALRINPNNQKALEWQRNTQALLAKTFVQRGVAAYKEEKKALARQFFEEAIKNDGENELAWLWLASVVERIEQKRDCLEKVLKINPKNETARNSLDAIKRQVARDLLKKANAAFISGRTADARGILDELMNFDPEIEEAWLLKAYLSESFNEKKICFEKVLSLNPRNEMARAGLEAIKDIQQFDEKVGEGGLSEESLSGEPLISSHQVETPAISEAKVLVENMEASRSYSFEETAKAQEELSSPHSPGSALEAEEKSDKAKSEESSEGERRVSQVAFDQEPPKYTEPDSAQGLFQGLGSFQQKEETLQKRPIQHGFSEAIGFETLKDSDMEKTPLEEEGIISPKAVEPEVAETIEDLRTEARAEYSEIEPETKVVEAEAGADTEMRNRVGADEVETEIRVEEIKIGDVEVKKTETAGAEEPVKTQVVTDRAIPTEAGLEKDVKRKIILVVDDSPTIRKLISVKLEKSGYEVRQAADGIEALAVIKQVVPDLILLDVTMPNLDGYQVCKMIRSNESTKDVPVIIISGKDGFFDKVRGQMAGSTGYITKPFGPETLINTIKHYLED